LDWENKIILKSEKAFAASAKAPPARARFSVGALEEGVDDPSVSNFRAFVAWFTAHHYPGLESETHIFDDENPSVVPATISRVAEAPCFSNTFVGN
jgi:hypothetical protein